MPAVSKAQQAFMAIAEHAPSKLRGPKPKMTKPQLREFAATKTKGLPAKKKPPMDARAKRIKDFEAKHGDAEF